MSEQDRYLIPPAGVAEPKIFDGRGAEGPSLVIHTDYKLTNIPAPEVGRRGHRFASVASFIEWIKQYGNNDHTEILVGDSEIIAVVEPSKPQPEMAWCKLSKHPYFALWFDMLAEEELTARDIFRTIGIAPKLIVGEPDAEDLRQKLGALSTEAKMERGQELTDAGDLKLTTAQAKRTLSVMLPSQIKIGGQIFLETPIVRVDFVFWLITNAATDGTVTFELECPGREAHEQKARELLAAHISDKLWGSPFVGVGDAGHSKIAVRPSWNERCIAGEIVTVTTADDEPVEELPPDADPDGEEIDPTGPDAGDE